VKSIKLVTLVTWLSTG